MNVIKRRNYQNKIDDSFEDKTRFKDQFYELLDNQKNIKTKINIKIIHEHLDSDLRIRSTKIYKCERLIRYNLILQEKVK